MKRSLEEFLHDDDEPSNKRTKNTHCTVTHFPLYNVIDTRTSAAYIIFIAGASFFETCNSLKIDGMYWNLIPDNMTMIDILDSVRCGVFYIKERNEKYVIFEHGGKFTLTTKDGAIDIFNKAGVL